jgi:hypothetical protein
MKRINDELSKVKEFKTLKDAREFAINQARESTDNTDSIEVRDDRVVIPIDLELRFVACGSVWILIRRQSGSV